MPGPAAFALLCAATSFVGVTIASWSFSRRGSDAALATITSGLAYLFLPVHVLGWLGVLTREALALVLTAIPSALLAVTLASPRLRVRWRDTVRTLARLARLGACTSWRSSNAALVGLVVVGALTLWTGWLAYLSPSASWDGLAYHEPMIALALQNRGFAWVGWDEAGDLLPQVDGFPRLVENVTLPLVIAWDRRVVDMVQSALLPAMVVCTYAALRRFVDSRALALGLACGFALLPGIVLQLTTSMVDLGFATCCAASIAWACRPSLRPAEVWQLGLALGLLGASKVTGLFVVPVVLAVALVPALRVRAGRRARLAHGAGALLLCAAMMAPTFVRNAARTGNPLWPARIEVLGFRLPGPLRLVDQNLPPERALAAVYSLPKPPRQDPDGRRRGYGVVAPRVLPPLALLGFALAVARSVGGRERARAWRLLAVAVPLVGFLLISPARHWARLNLHVVIGLLLLVGYWLGQRGRARLAEGVSMALVLGPLLGSLYSVPDWHVPLAEARARLWRTEHQRAIEPDGAPLLLPAALARAREAELGRGALVVVARATWIGLFWNERFDNRLEHLDAETRTAAEWIAEVDRRGARWVVVGVRGALRDALRRDPRWQWIGSADRRGAGPHVFRRAPGARLERPSDLASPPS
ncbi:MAG: hypothetical protein KF729_06420 [Sandaracinaceae bacterium]|nr:hypothetical protein [Sandaracinaceae bacterium]